MSELKLLKGEEILLRLRPHWLAFYDIYLIWLYVISLSLVFLVYGEQLTELFSVKNVLMLMVPPPAEGQLVKSTPIVSFFASVFGGLFLSVRLLVDRYSMVVFWFLLLVLPSVLIAVVRS